MNEYFIKIFENNECIKVDYCISEDKLFESIQELLDEKKNFSVHKARCVLDLS